MKKLRSEKLRAGFFVPYSGLPFEEGCDIPHDGAGQLFSAVWFDGRVYADALELWEATVTSYLRSTANS